MDVDRLLVLSMAAVGGVVGVIIIGCWRLLHACLAKDGRVAAR